MPEITMLKMQKNVANKMDEKWAQWKKNYIFIMTRNTSCLTVTIDNLNYDIIVRSFKTVAISNSKSFCHMAYNKTRQKRGNNKIDVKQHAS